MNRLFTELFKSFGVFLRIIKAFFLRGVRGITARIRRLKNIPRHAAQAAISTVQTAADVTQKPTKREDYIKIGSLLISKAFLIRLLLGIVIAGALIWFVIWPFILSHFLTARFYVKDERLPNWSGRVIVYSDKKKTLPLYEGKLEEGVLQGRGKRYDEDAILIYEGDFQNAVYSGTGREYEDGVLRYAGQFSNGVYEGSGILYDEEGVKLYEGQFVKGKYEGRGSLSSAGEPVYTGQFAEGIYEGLGILYDQGEKRYEGQFQQGVPSGSGIAYRDGVKRYEGQFADGVPSGIGKEYEADGRLLYEGGFAEGQYSGQGTLYPVQSQKLEAVFSKGEPDGDVRWSKGEKLYYTGGWADGMPSGFGTLYGQDGQTVYQGQFAGGTLDGEWLLTLMADELRSALGSEEQISNVKEDDNLYLIKSGTLGLTARCTYRTETAESSVVAAYLCAPKKKDSEWIRILPGMENVSDTLWPQGTQVQEGRESITFLPANLGVLNGPYDYKAATFTGGTAMLLSTDADSPPVMALWTLENMLPAAPDGKSGTGSGTGRDKNAESPEKDAKSVEDFLEDLDNMEGTAGAGLEEENPYFGEKSPDKPLEKAKTTEKTVQLLDIYVDYWLWAEKQKGYEENLTRTETLLSEAKDAGSMNGGNAETISALEKEKLRLQELIQNCQTGRKQAELQAQQIVTGNPEDYDLSQVLLLVDPAELDFKQLSLTAMAWAQAQEQEAGEAETELEIKSLLLRLEDAWNNVAEARGSFEAAAQTAQTAAGDFAMGKAEKSAWYATLSARTEIQISLYEALASYTRQINALNWKTGGWVSREYEWFEDEFGYVIPEPEEEPEAVESEEESDNADQTEPEPTADSETEQSAEPEKEPDNTAQTVPEPTAASGTEQPAEDGSRTELPDASGQAQEVEPEPEARTDGQQNAVPPGWTSAEGGANHDPVVFYPRAPGEE